MCVPTEKVHSSHWYKHKLTESKVDSSGRIIQEMLQNQLLVQMRHTLLYHLVPWGPHHPATIPTPGLQGQGAMVAHWNYSKQFWDAQYTPTKCMRGHHLSRCFIFGWFLPNFLSGCLFLHLSSNAMHILTRSHLFINLSNAQCRP